MPRQLSLAVRGADFANNKPKAQGSVPRRFEIATCRPGEPVELVLEPDNPHDPQAILILSARGVPIGYVSAERAPFIGRHIRQGEEVIAIFQQATRTAAVIRVSLDGSEPILPDIRKVKGPPASEDDHYHVDPIWPDD
nr:HIRAN domain-containing protein [Sphingomonas sp. Y57]